MPPPPALRGAYRIDLRARAAYAEAAGIYRILPAAVCLPADAEDLRSVVCWAAEAGAHLIPRGAGSGMSGGNVGAGVILDLCHTRDRRRLDINAVRRRAITSGPVTLAELNAAAGHHGLRLPPDPSSGKWATLGGMVSTNAAGARSVRFGSVRNWVEALTLITADGEVARLRRGSPQAGDDGTAALARFHQQAEPAIRAAEQLILTRFPHTRKNSSGYALDAFLASGEVIDLIIGAEGTLGIVTEIEWQLDPEPLARAGLRIWLGSTDDIGPLVAALDSFQPAAVELLDRSFLDVVGPAKLAQAGVHGSERVQGSEAEAVLLVQLESNDAISLRKGIDRAIHRVQDIALSVDIAGSVDDTERLWSIRHAASPILANLPESHRSLQVIEDACVPRDRMSEYIRAVRVAASSRGIPLVMFGHAGDGHIHVNLLPDIARPGWEKLIQALLDEVTEIVVRLGGTLSGEHGDGRLRAQALERIYGAEIVELFRKIKQSFDPLGIFNPGVILPNGDPPISHLKVGAGAVALPPDLELSLREIERRGDYARSRLDLADEESGERSPE